MIERIKKGFSWLQENTFFEMYLAWFFIARMFMVEYQSIEYYAVFIVAMILIGVSTIRTDIKKRFDKLEAKLEEQNKKQKGNK